MATKKIHDVLWFIPFLKPYKWIAIKAIISLAAAVVFSLIPPFLIKDMIDIALPSGDIDQMIWIFSLLCGALLVTALFQSVEEYYTANLGLKVSQELRSQLYAHIQKMPTQFFLETKTGAITTRFSSDIYNMNRICSKTLPGIFTNSTMFIVSFALMLSLNVKLTFVAVATIPVYLFLLFFIVKINNRLAKTSFSLSDEVNGNLTDNFSFEGQMHSRVNGLQQQNRSVFQQNIEKMRSVRLKMGLLIRGNETIFHLLSMMGIALVYLVGGILSLTDEVTLGTIIAFSVFVTRLYQPLSFFSTSAIELASAMVSATRLREYFEMQQDDVFFNSDSVQASLPITQSEHAIVFKNLFFSFDKQGKEFNVLDNFSGKIKRGQKVAIVGENGAGKSTLVQLIAGIYTPRSGDVLINGRSVKSISYKEFNQHICIIFSNSYFINGTIKENLQSIKPNVSEAELSEALLLSQSTDFIKNLADGIDTRVGQGGYRLSSGQRQRLALARMFLSNAPIVICDEVTSNLNGPAEKVIINNILNKFSDRTVIMISHSPSVIDCLDYVIEMKTNTRGEETALADEISKELASLTA